MQPKYIGLHLHSPGYGGTSVAEPKDSMPFCCYVYNQSPLKGISFSQVTTTTLSIQFQSKYPTNSQHMKQSLFKTSGLLQKTQRHQLTPKQLKDLGCPFDKHLNSSSLECYSGGQMRGQSVSHTREITQSQSIMGVVQKVHNDMTVASCIVLTYTHTQKQSKY